MKTLVDVVHDFAKRKGIALVYKTGFRTFHYSYADLYEKALQSAALLQELGAKKGDRVLIWAANSPQWACFFLGCTLAGVITVPVDVRSDASLVRSIQKDVSASLIFQTRYRQKAVQLKSIVAEELFEQLPAKKPKLPALKASDTVELLYTSGTTGTPKGVILTHRNIAANIGQVRAVLPVDSKYRLLSVLPLSHVFEQTAGFFLPLSVGARIVYLRALKPSTLLETMRQERITTMLVVPRLLDSLEAGIRRQFAGKKLGKLLDATLSAAKPMPRLARRLLFYAVHRKFGRSFRFFAVGGAPFSEKSEKFWDRVGMPVLQGYGLTETSPVLTFNPPGQKKFGSAGQVLPGVELRIADDGEVLARGPNVTSGYYNDAKKTAESYKDGWFHTGDSGVLDDHNYLFLKGRKKHMIVTAEGMNVYAEDVESVLNEMKGIDEACVVGIARDSGEQVHAVLLTKLAQRDVAALIRKANEKLQAHQQIAGYTVWPDADFPRTPTMKVKKADVAAHVQDAKKSVAQSHDRLIALVAQVSSAASQDITPASNLSKDLHMSSIDRVELITLLEMEYNLDIDESFVNDKTTVAHLQKIVQERRASRRQRQRAWVRTVPMRLLRYAVQQLLIQPIFTVYVARTVKGSLPPYRPVVLYANHSSNLDVPAILLSVPKKYRKHTVPAAGREFFANEKDSIPVRLVKRVLELTQTMFVGTFTFDQSERSLQSLQYAGKLIDEGESILIFPSGRLGGEEFKEGVGVLARELAVPLIPVKLAGLEDILPPGVYWPRKRGRATITFGRAIDPKEFAGLSTLEITKKVKKELDEL